MDDTKQPPNAGTDSKSRDAVDDATAVYERAYHLSPETARLAAADNAASGDRKPASDGVEEEREAAAQADERR
ncbi:MAG: hypothetical protein NVSMB19_12120 [Vulcanimicrobiaceae bacterium]